MMHGEPVSEQNNFVNHIPPTASITLTADNDPPQDAVTLDTTFNNRQLVNHEPDNDTMHTTTTTLIPTTYTAGALMPTAYAGALVPATYTTGTHNYVDATGLLLPVHDSHKVVPVSNSSPCSTSASLADFGTGIALPTGIDATRGVTGTVSDSGSDGDSSVDSPSDMRCSSTVVGSLCHAVLGSAV
eukprot:Lankesteria_metandrocarpae@DN9957_c0_g1_i1.p1